MTFEEVLDQALDMLRRRGRLTYGALKRQFGLDDAYLADLKDALLYADAHVVDDAGRGLRWTGEPLSTAQRAFAGVARFYGEAGVLWLVRALLQQKAVSPIAPSDRSLALTRPAGGCPSGAFIYTLRHGRGWAGARLDGAGVRGQCPGRDHRCPPPSHRRERRNASPSARPWHSGSRTPAVDGAVLRSGRLHQAQPAARPRRPAPGGARLPGDRRGGHPAL